MIASREQTLTSLAQMIHAAREGPVDLLLRNARCFDLFNGAIREGNIAIHDGMIIGFGQYSALREIDLAGAYLCPGLIDGHIHIESTMVSPVEFGRAVLPRGTTAVVADPHELANVWGIQGIKYMLSANAYTPLDIFVILPSCVPATQMETSGATLSAEELIPFKDHPMVPGLGEVMNYPGVIHGEPGIMEKLAAFSDQVIDGHCPGLSGRELCAYVAAGIHSDHECATLEEAREKLSLGMAVMIREGSTARNLEALLPLAQKSHSHHLMFVTDDKYPGDLWEDGHLDHILRRAVALGLDLFTAVRMATLNPAKYFRLRDRGALAPGYRADLVAFDDLEHFRVRLVIKDGVEVARDGRLTDLASAPGPSAPPSDLTIRGLSSESLRVKREGEHVRVMGLVPGQIITEKLLLPAWGKGPELAADPESDLLKVAVVERHRGTGRVGVGFIRGMGLQQGALASTVAHDSHNLILVGTRDEDMLEAAEEVRRMGGGQAIVSAGSTIASFPLPIAGLMSDQGVLQARSSSQKIIHAAKELGCKPLDPFMSLSFLALPVIPHLKLTDLGLVDVDSFQIISLFH
ncbi:MAG: adenine deaminase [Deltaproteobacteria bacterium]|nr:adenine deaminase [Deltaproteobacteria bacterium]